MPNESAFVLCQTDGQIVAGNHVWRRWFAMAADCARLEEVSARLACPALVEAVWRFDGPTERVTLLTIGSQAYQLRLHRLGEMLLLEFGLAASSVAPGSEAALLVQIGRLTSRLIHDFKNQMGGLKLYASYLKKRLAAAELGVAGKESAEIADKIIESLNTMAETATLVSRLTKPVELRREVGNLAELIAQVMNDQAARAAARQVTLTSVLSEDLPELNLDGLQLRGALNVILARAIEVSPMPGVVICEVQQSATDCVLTITDQGLALTEAQRQALFDFVTNERLNKAALELGFAKQVIEAHGGSLTAVAAGPAGTRVSVRFPTA